MAIARTRRTELRSERPPLAGTPWNVLLAAVVERVSELHGLEPPAMEPGAGAVRGHAGVFLLSCHRHLGTVVYAPAAFIRQGALANACDLDARGGERLSGFLDRDRIRQLFDELSAALPARGVRGPVYLVGGGALITGYGRDRTTKDVDVRIDEAKDEVFSPRRKPSLSATTR